MKKAALSLWESVLKTDREAAVERVRQLRKRQPKASREQLHRQLVATKCIQVGVIGALTAITGAVPGLSKLARFALGPMVDATLVSAMQAELVIETFFLYDVAIPEHGEKVAVLAIAATNLGADEIARQASQWITARAGKLLGTQLLNKAWPIAKIATTAATHIALTYSIGKRTQALCQIKGARISDWPSLFRRVVSIDQTALTEWATKSLRMAFDQVGEVAGGLSRQLLQLLPRTPEPAMAGATVERLARTTRTPKTRSRLARKTAAKKAPAPVVAPDRAKRARKPAKPSSGKPAARTRRSSQPVTSR